MNARRLGVVLVAVLALVAAGCGGGGSDQASSDTSTAVSESTTEETTATVETTTTESSSDTTDADMSALTGRCAQLAGLGSKLAATMSGQDGDVQDMSKLFDEVADQVPDEIKADWQVLADNFSKIADALKGTDLSSGTPNAETLAKLQKLASSLDSQKVQQAAAHIEAWAKKNC